MKVQSILILLVFALASCARRDGETLVRVSVPNQKLMVFKRGVEVAMYDCSTSKYGVGDQPGSYRTPLGRMVVAQKIGDNLPAGMKLANRRPTGEIVRPNSPGRDPIVSRILWLRGTERQNAQAFNRAIYIHGTAEERTIGTPASYGCIRMRSKDVIKLYDMVGVGATVEVLPSPFPAPLVREPTVAPTPAPTVVATVAPTPAPKVASRVAFTQAPKVASKITPIPVAKVAPTPAPKVASKIAFTPAPKVVSKVAPTPVPKIASTVASNTAPQPPIASPTPSNRIAHTHKRREPARVAHASGVSPSTPSPTDSPSTPPQAGSPSAPPPAD